MAVAVEVVGGADLAEPLGGSAFEHGVAGQAQDVADVVGIAPAHQSPAAKAAVAAEGDADVGPDLAQAGDEQFEDGRGVVIGADVGGSQVGDEQLRAAEDVERQEAIAVVVAVEEAVFLVAVDGIVGGVEVEGEVFGRRGEGGDELFDEDGGESDQGRAVDAVFESAQGRRRGEWWGASSGPGWSVAACQRGSSRRRWWSLRSS